MESPALPASPPLHPGAPAGDVADYLACCERALASLGETSTADLLAIERTVAGRLGADEVAARHRALARGLLERHAPAIPALRVPADVRAGLAAEFARIGADLDRKPAAYFAFANYRFKADLRILCLRRFPAGMFDLEVGGIPRKAFLAQRPGPALRLAWAVARAGGVFPFFRTHMSPHRMHLWKPTERERFMGLVGGLLRDRPEIRGLMSTAWWNDPAVARVSPHLAYLREDFERLGMGVFRMGTSPTVVDEATTFSFERKRLVEAGAYTPAVYLGLALRAQLLPLAPPEAA